MRLKWIFWDILGHFGTYWEIMGQLGILFDEFGAFRQFSHAFPTIFSPYRRDGRTEVFRRGPIFSDCLEQFGILSRLFSFDP